MNLYIACIFDGDAAGDEAFTAIGVAKTKEAIREYVRDSAYWHIYEFSINQFGAQATHDPQLAAWCNDGHLRGDTSFWPPEETAPEPEPDGPPF